MTLFDPLSETLWKTEGKCYDLVYPQSVEDIVVMESFFADSVDERQPAAQFCDGCPVQQRCLKFAMETGQLWGVWGGRDEFEIRRNLWVNSSGATGTRAKFPRCSWCMKDNTLVVENEKTHKILCESCGFSWKSETTQLGVEARKSKKVSGE